MDQAARPVAGPTRFEIAEALLEAIPVSVIRREVRRRRSWAGGAFPGFRADSLTRSMIIRGSSRFAVHVGLLSELAVMYLESIGAAAGTHAGQSLVDAAVENSEFSERLRTLVAGMDGRTLEELPLRSDPPAKIGRRVMETSVTAREPEETGSTQVRNEAPSTRDSEAARTPTRPSPKASDETGPEFLRERVFLNWEPPDDDIEEAQKAVTLFGRSLTAFVRRQLEGAYGDRWLGSGCPKDVREALRKESERKQGPGGAIPPASLLGYAEQGHLFKIILAGNNWRVFEPYFGKREEVELRMREILGLRVGAMHPEDREIDFLTNVAKFSAMARIAEAYDPTTAKAITDLCQSLADSSSDVPGESQLVGDRIESNLDTLRDPQASGREPELRELERFWRDPFERVMSISGAGGVGKTVLIHQFVSNLLQQACPVGTDPNPFGLVYLTAKNNYLPGFHVPDPESVRFGSLREVIDSTIGLGLDGDRGPDGADMDRRRRCLEIAEAFRILFVLDNLETLTQEAAQEIYEFISTIPRPSKVILTSRIGREAGTPLVLKGLPKDDARTLLERRLSLHGDLLGNHDPEQIENIIDYSNGFPMTLVHCANLIGKNGYTAEEAMEKLHGATMLEFLEFSFGSSIDTLNDKAFRVLAFLSFAPSGKTRKELEQVAGGQDVLDEILYDLATISFIERMPDTKKTPKFRVTSEQLRDYVNALARRRLPDAVFAQLRGAAVPLVDYASPSLDVEVERSLRGAKAAAADGWGQAAEILEGAIAKWGEDPRLVAKLGYYYFRMLQRSKAIAYLDKAIRLGSDSPTTFTDLAIVMYHERDYEGSLRKAEAALAMDPGNPIAHQLIAQCLVQIAERGRFALSDERKVALMERAVRHAQDSLVADERTYSQTRHNELSRQWITRAEEGLSALREWQRAASFR